MNVQSRLLVVSVLAAGAAGCGGASGAPGDVDAFLSRFYAAACTIQVSCGDMPDRPTCLASLPLDGTDLRTLRADVASGKVHYDSTKGGACLAYAERLYGSACTRTALAAVDTTGRDTCDEVFVGTVADGGACALSFQCASGTCALTDNACLPAQQCCAGSCAATKAPIPVGADCGGSLDNLNCETGSVCTVTATVSSPKCITPSKVVGTACLVAYECASPLFCDIAVATSTGTCQPSAARGVPCNSYVGTGSCDDLRDYCPVSTDTCTPRGEAGAPCSSLDPNSCLGSAQCIGSTCVALSPESGACDSTNGSGCLGGLECSPQTDTCGFPAGAGACP